MGRSLASRLRTRPPVGTQNQPVPMDFGDWAPDLPDFSNPGAIRCNNVLPAANSYIPARALTDVSLNALDTAPLGAITARGADDNVYTYAGDTAKLYELVDNTWTDESKAGGYGTTASNVWEFAIWDPASQIIATNFDDDVQQITIGGGSTGAFADLITSTNKPKAKHLAVVRNFLVLGHTNDATDGLKTDRVWWSAIGNPTDFDPDATTQSDFADLDSGGSVQHIVGGAEYGVVFQESSIRRMEYVGTPVIFDLPAVDRKRGTPIPNSVIGYGRHVFFISEEGFYRFNGSSSESIGGSRVDKTFWRQFDVTNKRQVSTSIDVLNKLVCWAFPVNGSETPNKIYCYKWDTGRWSEIDIEVQIIFGAQNQGYTLEGLDAVDNNIETLTPSLDSDVWKGGKRYSAAFSPSSVLSSFDGPTLKATLDTREQLLTPGRASYIDSVRPLVDAQKEAGDVGIQIQIAGRNGLEQSFTFDAAALVNAEGLARTPNQSRYHRVRTIIPAGVEWQHAQGVVVNKSGRGRYNGASVA